MFYLGITELEKVFSLGHVFMKWFLMVIVTPHATFCKKYIMITFYLSSLLMNNEIPTESYRYVARHLAVIELKP